MKLLTKVALGIVTSVTLGVVGMNQSVEASTVDHRVDSVGNYYDEKLVTVQSAIDPWYVLDWDQSDLNNVCIFHNDGNWNQKWGMMYNEEDDSYTIMCGPHLFDNYLTASTLTETKNLDSFGYNKVGSYGGSFYNSSHWKLHKVGNHVNGGVYQFRNAQSGKLLDLSTGNVGNGESLVTRQYTKDGIKSQEFVIHVEGEI